MNMHAALLRRASLMLMLLTPDIGAATPLDSAFTYQGELRDAGVAANGLYDFEFCLATALTGPVLSCQPVLASHPVEDGLFTATLNFGSAPFAGEQRFIEVRVRPAGGTEGFATLLPRQAISVTPYALRALGVVDGAVGALQLGAGSVSADKLVDAGVTLPKLASNSVDAARIVDGSIGRAELADGAVGLTQIDPAAVQARVHGSCANGGFMQGVGQDGSVACGNAATTQAPVSYASVASAESPLQLLGAHMTLDAEGNPALCYTEANFDSSLGNFTSARLVYLRCNDAHCLGGDDTLRELDTGAVFAGVGCRIALDRNGNAVIAHGGGQDSLGLRLTRCADANCAAATSSTLHAPNGINVAQTIALALDVADHPQIAFDNASSDALLYLACNDVACAGGDEVVQTVEDNGENLANAVTLVLGTDGLPLITHFNITGQSLRVVKCNDSRCAPGGETITELAGAGAASAGSGASVTLAADGLPLVAFSDSSGMLVARCNDHACSGSGEVISRVYTHPGTSAFFIAGSAITQGVDGLPMLAFLDASGPVLRLLRCDTPSCANQTNPAYPLDAGGSQSAPLSLLLAGGLRPALAFTRRAGAGDVLRLLRCSGLGCR